MTRTSPLLRSALIALSLLTAAPALAFDMPLLTFPEKPATATTSASNGK
jgi:hypothetical protein